MVILSNSSTFDTSLKTKIDLITINVANMINRLFNKTNSPERNSILIVDDNKSMLFLLKNILSSEFNVVTFSNAIDAKNWLDQGNGVDAIVSDINLEHGSGIDFAKNLKFSNGISETPIVFLSAESENHLNEQLASINYSAYIQKPFNPENLVSKVKQATQLAFN